MGERWSYFVAGRRGGHYSPRGNRWVARVLAERLREIAPELVVKR